MLSVYMLLLAIPQHRAPQRKRAVKKESKKQQAQPKIPKGRGQHTKKARQNAKGHSPMQESNPCID
jgi:hypothetical protein